MVFMDAYLINMITETCRRLHNIHWGCVSGFIISSTAVFIHHGSRCTDRPRGHCSCKSSSLRFKLLHLSLLSYVLFSTSSSPCSCSEPLVRSFPSGVNTAVRRVLMTLKHKHTHHEACDVTVLNMWPDPSHLHPLQTDSSGHIPDPHLMNKHMSKTHCPTDCVCVNECVFVLPCRLQRWMLKPVRLWRKPDSWPKRAHTLPTRTDTRDASATKHALSRPMTLRPKHTYIHVTLEHKSGLKSLGYICSNSQKCIVWVIDFSFMGKSLKIMFHEYIL